MNVKIHKPADKDSATTKNTEHASGQAEKPSEDSSNTPNEIGGRKGPEPTRYGDWEKGGRCIDF